MSERMKVLIAYDGSGHAQLALADLRRAGLPPETEALVVSVAEGLSRAHSSAGGTMAQAVAAPGVRSAVAHAREHEAPPLEDAQELALEAARRIRSHFPGWDVRGEGVLGAPATEILRKAEEWRADLIVVGSRGRSALGRLVFGSVSRKVANEAGCSVRIVRRRPQEGCLRVRIVVGVDGSASAAAAARAVAARAWPAWSEARLTTATLPFFMYGVAPERQRSRMAHIHRATKATLRDAGLSVSSVIKEGDAKSVLVAEAESWGADCIFVGSRGLESALKRFLLGSVSAALVLDAPCSLEVIRTREGGSKYSCRVSEHASQDSP